MKQFDQYEVLRLLRANVALAGSQKAWAIAATQFERLCARWKDETAYSPTIEQSAMHPAYQMIMAVHYMVYDVIEMNITYEVLNDSTPKYHDCKDKAVIRHNTEGIKLWRRIKGIPASFKPYATGDIPAWMVGDLYEEYPRS